MSLLEVDGPARRLRPGERARATSRFGVDEGETVALLGANGAGKTTTLRAICGMLKPRGKRDASRGQDVTGRATEQIVRLGVAHVPEGRGTFAPLTVEENLRLGAYTRATATGRGRARLRALPAPAGAPHAARRDAQRRRAADARDRAAR